MCEYETTSIVDSINKFFDKIEPDKKCMARCQDRSHFFPPKNCCCFGQDNCENFGIFFFFSPPSINLTNFAKMLGKLANFQYHKIK